MIYPEATHFPILSHALLTTSGPIVEFGTGDFSTSLIAMLRHLRDTYHYDDNSQWLQRAQEKAYPRGQPKDVQFRQVSSNDWINIEPIKGSLLFVDFYPAIQRGIVAKNWLGKAEVIVCHDTEPVEQCPYQYPLLWKAAEEAGYALEIDQTLFPHTTKLVRVP